VHTSEDSKVTFSVEGGVAIARIANPLVKGLGIDVGNGLADAIRCTASEDGNRALVIASEGRIFSAGADITEFGKPPAQPLLPDVIAMLDDMKKPVIAAISGAALGGGFELTLGHHYRIAAPGTKLGLPGDAEIAPSPLLRKLADEGMTFSEYSRRTA
jgi:3-hydroxyacyl-CoA dehydrogenase